MLLDALKEENLLGQINEELTRTLNDISQQNTSFGGLTKIPSPTITTTNTAITSTTNQRKYSIGESKYSIGERKYSIGDRRSSFGFRSNNAKTEKDKYNTKERRNSRYFVRNGDKEAIESRANSLKRAINTVMEQSGLYDHKPKHGSRKHSLAALNIPTNISSKTDSPLTPPLIVEPEPSSENQQSGDETIVTDLSPLPEQRRTSMDEYFFNSVNLPVPKQFADAASRRSSGVTEPIEEEENNGHSVSIDDKIISHIDMDYNYDVGYLSFSDENKCESAVPYEVYERNLLRIINQQHQHSTASINKENSFNSDETSVITKLSPTSALLQVPVITMSEVDMMERNPLNVYTSENMTIIDTDQVVRKKNSIFHTINQLIDFFSRLSFIIWFSKEQSLSEDNGGVEASDILSAISNEECSVTSEILDKNSSGNSQQSQSHINAAEIIQVFPEFIL